MSSVSSSPEPHEPAQHPDGVQQPHVEAMTIRRAPNLLAFLTLGAVVGAFVGVLVALVGAQSMYYTQAAVVGFFLVIGVTLGAVAGAIVALIIDRASIKRSRRVTAEVEERRDGSAHVSSS